MNANGAAVWNQVAGIIGISSMSVTPDSSCILTGTAITDTPFPAFITKISLGGAVLWTVTKTVVDTFTNDCKSAQCLPNGDILACVEAGYYGTAGFLQISPDGKTVTVKKIASLGTYHTRISNFMCLNDGGIIVYGTRYMYGGDGDEGGYVPWFVKLDSKLDTLYSIEPQNGAEYLNGLVQTSNGSCLYGCNIASGGYSQGGLVWVTTHTKVGLSMLMSDQIAYTGVHFTYHVPVNGDSLSYTYILTSPPAGMTVSAGGTITWTPGASDVSSKYRTITCLVGSAGGTVDTLSLLLKVEAAGAALPLPRKQALGSDAMKVTYNAADRKLQVTSVFPYSKVEIVDVRGRVLASFVMLGSHAEWSPDAVARRMPASGTYMVRLSGGGMQLSKQASMCR